MLITSKCSRFFTFEMLFHCSETWQRLACTNEPEQLASWDAYQALAQEVLDPLVANFGQPMLTFGFCGPQLRRSILSRKAPGIAPALDQHAACELNQNGKLICLRRGAAVDIFYPNIPSTQVAHWLATHTPFDRLYFYGAKRPLHISHGPEHSKAMIQLQSYQGRRLPRALYLSTLQGWL